jgi:hypothetical protein
MQKTAEEWIAEAKAAIAKAKAAALELWDALPPNFQHDSIKTLQDGISDLGSLAETEVQAHAPADVAGLLDDAIAAAEAKLETLQAARAAVAS